MNNNMKMIWKIIVISIVAGLILATLGFTLGASRSLFIDRTGVHASGNEITHIAERDLASFRNVNVDVGFSDVEFVSSNAFGIEINSGNAEFNWSLENDTLSITIIRRSGVHMSFNFLPIMRDYVKIFVPPDAMLDTVTVQTRSGDVRIGGIQAASVEVNSSTGDIRLNDISSDYLQVGSSSGDIIGSSINAKDFICNARTGDGRLQAINAERFSAERTSGDLTITGGELNMVSITVRTGDITLNGITSSGLNVQATSGDIRLSGDFSGESIIQARTGDVRVSTSRERDDYSFDLSARSGTIRFDGERLRGDIKSSPIQENHIDITTTSGDINVSFTG